MANIELSQGKVAIVDDADYEWLNQWSWSALDNHGKGWYAKRTGKEKPFTIYMHRVILGVNKGVFVDHINGNGLDNRRDNLRIASNQENMRNRHRQLNNTSGYRGVSWHKTRKKWGARIRYEDKLWHLGWFDDPKIAALAYNDAALKYFGEFAALNEVPDELG